MIRREGQNAAGAPEWIIISQVAHARISGEIAQAWGAAPFHSLAEHPVVVEAIFRHDDGWRPWEAQPTLDPEQGRPHSFLEMPDNEALEIWRRSIESVDDLGPLAQAMVAGHFALLRRHSDDPADSAGGRFVREMTEKSEQWVGEWIEQDPATHTQAAAESAFDYLRMLDGVSLWLCCSEPTEPQKFTPPEGPAVTFTPCGEGRIELDPWPLTVESLPLEINGRTIPATFYRNADQLAEADSEQVTLRWELAPA